MKLVNNYRIDEMGTGETCLWIKDKLTQDSIEAIASESFDYLKIDDGEWNDLEVLHKYSKKIKQIYIRTSNVNLEQISGFKYLESLDISGKYNTQIDFNRLPKLKRLITDWNIKYINSLKNLDSLVTLAISGYKGKDLNFLGDMPNLRNLILINSKTISSLEHIGKFNNLEYLRVLKCSKLSDFKELNLLPNLKVLSLSNCKKEFDYSVLSKLQSIDEIHLEGTMGNLSWLQSLKTLRKLRFNCSLEDGNLDFLYELPNLQFILLNNKRNFTVKLKDISKFLSDKGFDQLKLRNEIYIPNEFDNY